MENISEKASSQEGLRRASTWPCPSQSPRASVVTFFLLSLTVVGLLFPLLSSERIPLIGV